MAIETEIKFKVPDRELYDSIVPLKNIAGYTASDRGTETISDTYFDTPDNRLLNEKSVFRLRMAGSKPVLAFKSHQPSGGSFYRRIEIESPVEITPEDITSGPLPGIPPCRAFSEKFGAVRLSVSMNAGNNRRRILLQKDGVAQFELVLDDVTFSGPRGTHSVCELEVESLGGTDEELEKIGAWLKKKYDLNYAGPSKYILGMNFVGNVGNIGNAGDVGEKGNV
ncbi:CYTH domain-containing protein [Candidatus Latescibacterota bacterium]